MRFSSRTWFLLSALLFVAAVWFWLRGNEEVAKRDAARKSASGQGTNLPQFKSAGAVQPGQTNPASAPRATAAAPGAAVAPPPPPASQSNFPYRLRNTQDSLDQLGMNDAAVLLDNAFIDTSSSTPVAIPEHLRAEGDPGSYVVQSRGPLDAAFYRRLQGAGAAFVSYIPNNAALVRATDAVARQLAALPEVRAVLRYEPYYKLAHPLLAVAVEQQPLPLDQALNVTVFAGEREKARASLQQLGAVVVAEDSTPFGPVLTVKPHPDRLIALAQLPEVQRIEPANPRTLLNDLTRVRVRVSTDTVVTNNYLDLTGSNVLVNINDSGVDQEHPDLKPRVFSTDPDPRTLLDFVGHGTHVAGTIASSGTQSALVTGVEGSVTNADFRGKAPAASLFVLPIDLQTGPLKSDAYLQETAATANYTTAGRTNPIISNNSWGYINAFEYNASSASFDAAVRDALPGVTGSQPILYVFAAGNSGFGTTNGTVGRSDTVLAPATAKNVISVGAVENRRDLTNETFAGFTDSNNEIASFSSRGNVGIGTEGEFGRFKPDVVAPGTFIVSTRSANMAVDPAFPDLGPLYRYESGTSMAAPAVSGVLALMQEFFERKLSRGFSPALMKALLINGARSVNPDYDLEVNTSLNFQGWGLISLTNSLPSVLTNVSDEASWPVRFIDQSPTNALATGQRHTWTLKVSSNALFLPLRATVVWTDPPGNPGAGIKLVNDLDLVVTNLDSGEVFPGNNIPAGFDFTEQTDTNSPVGPDFVNNVENVFLEAPLGVNYSISVIGRRVNVNAVTANTNEIVQDYALVISSGNGQVTNSFESFLPQIASPLPPRPVTAITNGVPLLEQRVGANFQLAPSTNGVAAQWNFYVFTNAVFSNNPSGLINGSNVAFVTFLPPNVSRSRNLDADIDLYVSTDAQLTNLVQGVLVGARKSRNRSGTELVIFTNAVVDPPSIYYIGVKSEDQQAAEYGLAAFSTDVPFESTDADGNRILRGVPPNAMIPDGSPSSPGFVPVFAFGISDTPIARVVVTNEITHQSVGDLLGNLSHEDQFAVLNNHNTFGGSGNNGFFQIVYDDSSNGQFFFSRHTDGPGTLNNFAGQNSSGVWLLTMSDDSLNRTGMVNSFTVRVEPQQLLTSAAGINDFVLPNQWQYYFIDVPADATNLTVILSSVDGPLNLYLRRGALPTTTDFDKSALIDLLGGSLSIGLGDVPPLNAGRYFIGVFNPTAKTVSYNIRVILDRNPAALAAQTYVSTNPPPILLDDAVALSSLLVTNNRPVTAVEVAVRIDHARASDLVLHVVDPRGTRVLLAENRGGANPLGYGVGSGSSAVAVTNVVATVMQDGFETVPEELAVPAGRNVSGWSVDSGSIDVLGPGSVLGPAHSPPNWIDIQGSDFGVISTNINTTPGTLYRLSFAYTRNPDSQNPGPASANINMNGGLLLNVFAPVDNAQGNPNWKTTSAVFTATSPLTRIEVASENVSHPFAGVFFDTFKVEQLEVQLPLIYTVFTEDTNKTTTPIKFGVAPFANAAGIGSVPVLANSFEGAFPTNYCAVTNFAGWQVISNEVTLVGSPNSHTGTNYLELRNGQVVLDLPTTAGNQYLLQHVYRRSPPDPSLVSWWPGEGTGSDVVSTNHGSLANGVSFTNGMVGQAFRMDGIDDYILVPASSNLNVGSLTFDAWIYPTSVSAPLPILEYSAPTGFVGAHFWVNFSGSITPGRLYVNFRDALVPGNPGNHVLASAPDMVRLGEWQHVAATYDKTTGEAKLFLNGAAIAAANLGIFDPLTSLPLNIGQRPVGVSETVRGANFAGRMDELDVWNRALSANEIRAIYLAGSAGKCGAQTLRFPTPISWWPGENNPNDIVDGNLGTMVGGVSFGGGLVGQSFSFNGANEVRVNDNTNLNLQRFTIETWVLPTSLNGEMKTILYKESDDSALRQYALAIKGATNYSCVGAIQTGELAFAIYGTNGLVLPNLPVDFCGWINGGGNIPLNQWTHIALTYDGSSVTTYINGAISRNFTNVTGSVAPFSGPLRIGSRSPAIVNPFPLERFNGLIDELAIYDQGLDACDIKAIYDANSKGKYTLPRLPAPCEVSAEVIVDDRLTNTVVSLDWNTWQTNQISFTATQNGTPVKLLPNEPEMWFDSFEFSELTGRNNYYFPEEQLKPFVGGSALGTWTLEAWDNRVGGAIQLPTIVSWELRFIFANTNPPAIVLTNCTPFTNVVSVYETNCVPQSLCVAGREIKYFIVNVPRSATLATNLVVSTGNMVVFFNQDGLPTGTSPGDVPFGPFFILDANTNAPPPQLKPGRRYYLGVANFNPLETNCFTLSVAFDRIDASLVNPTVLTNGVCSTNTIPVTNALDYYEFTVSTNATSVSFDVAPQNGNVDLVVRKALPVADPLPRPNPGGYDYISQNPGTAAEQIVVNAASSPAPLSPGLWYLGVFNRDTNAVAYSVCVTESTNALYNIIRLTNNVPRDFTISSNAQFTNFFLFTVTQPVPWVQFELSNLTGDADLLVDLNYLPSSTNYVTGAPGSPASPALIRLDTNIFSDLTGDWYLAVGNRSGADLGFTIKATAGSSGGVFINPQIVISNNFICLSWASVPGQDYYIEGTTSLAPPVWTPVSPTITATDTNTTYCLPITGAQQYFRVVEGSLAGVPVTINFTSLVFTGTSFVLTWTAPPFRLFQVQYTYLLPPTWNTIPGIVSSPTGTYTFTDDGTQTGGLNSPRFYRLIQLP